MPSEFTPRRSKHSRERRAISVADWFWERLGVLADRDYAGNHSRALEGLLLFDWIIETVKKRAGKRHEHFITAPLVLNPGEIEPLLDRLRAGDSDHVGSYIDLLIEKRAEELIRPELPGLKTKS